MTVVLCTTLSVYLNLYNAPVKEQTLKWVHNKRSIPYPTKHPAVTKGIAG